LGEKKKEKKYFAAYKLLDWNLDAVGATEVYGEGVSLWHSRWHFIGRTF
jgi:hypothetical protein